MLVEDAKLMSTEQLALLGSGEVGYIRAVETDDGPRYELYAATGERLATAETIEGAMFAAQHLDIEPITRH